MNAQRGKEALAGGVAQHHSECQGGQSRANQHHHTHLILHFGPLFQAHPAEAFLEAGSAQLFQTGKSACHETQRRILEA